MKTKRKLSLILALFLCITALIAVTPQAQAAGYFSQSDVSNVESTILSNPAHAAYVDAMMRYHILSPDNNYRIGRNIANGSSIVFFFDGCSDNVDDPVYGNYNNYHLSAYCAVVQKVGGVPKVVFESENCSTIPDNPRNITYNDNDPVPTLLDGIYNIVSTNHKGRYAALNICDQSYSSAPVIRCDDNTSYISTSAGINIHARRYFPEAPENGVTSETYNSTGCLNVGLASDSWEEYNEFIYTVLGVSNAIITTPDEDGEWTQCEKYLDKGVVVVDRSRYRAQLADIYGSDNAHTATALVSKITAYTDILNKSWNAPFADIRFADWQYSAAEYALEKSLMAGKGIDTYGRIKFDPNNSITREEFAQVLYNAEGKPTVTIENPFPDVKNDWYKNAVRWANQAGIASGMGNGNFGVGLNISRQDLAMMLYKYAGMKGYSLDAEAGKIDRFADGNSVADYAKTAMNWAVTNGVLSGKGAAGADISTFRLDPAGTATRAECAAMLRNFMTAFEEVLSACRHSAMTKTETKPATCTENGNIAYWYCTLCDKYFADSTAATEITLADTVVEAPGHSWNDATCTEPQTCATCGATEGNAPGHSLSLQKTVASTCGDQGYDLYKCANCDYTEKKNFTAATGNHTMELVSNTATCTSAGVKTYKCQSCTYTTEEKVAASGSHQWETMTVADAAPKCADLGNYGLQKYSRMTDINITICTKCGYADYESACSIYTATQETNIMVGLTQPVRREFMYNDAIEAGYTPEQAEQRFEDYKHVADSISINHAKRRAQEIVSDYSHNGMPINYRENINMGAQNIQTDFENWINSSGHRDNIEHWGYPYVGYTRHIVGDNDTETITVYSVLLMGYHRR